MPDAADLERPAPDLATLAELTTEPMAPSVSRNAVPPADVPALIATVHAALSALCRPVKPAAEPPKPVPPVPVRKSIGDDHLVSLEDGKRYRSLKRHLARFGLTPVEYRAKWGLPPDYPMVAPAYARARSALAKQMGLGNIRRKR